MDDERTMTTADEVGLVKLIKAKKGLTLTTFTAQVGTVGTVYVPVLTLVGPLILCIN